MCLRSLSGDRSYSFPQKAYDSHSIAVYASYTDGNTEASETIHFRITEPFPTTLVAIASVSAAAVDAGALVYFKKRNH